MDYLLRFDLGWLRRGRIEAGAAIAAELFTHRIFPLRISSSERSMDEIQGVEAVGRGGEDGSRDSDPVAVGGGVQGILAGLVFQSRTSTASLRPVKTTCEN